MTVQSEERAVTDHIVKQYKGKVAFITGGRAGIGKEYIRVGLLRQREEKLVEMEKKTEALVRTTLAIQNDILTEDSTREIVAKLDPALDRWVLVFANVGFNEAGAPIGGLIQKEETMPWNSTCATASLR